MPSSPFQRPGGPRASACARPSRRPVRPGCRGRAGTGRRRRRSPGAGTRTRASGRSARRSSRTRGPGPGSRAPCPRVQRRHRRQIARFPGEHAPRRDGELHHRHAARGPRAARTISSWSIAARFWNDRYSPPPIRSGHANGYPMSPRDTMPRHERPQVRPAVLLVAQPLRERLAAHLPLARYSLSGKSRPIRPWLGQALGEAVASTATAPVSIARLRVRARRRRRRT